MLRRISSGTGSYPGGPNDCNRTIPIARPNSICAPHRTSTATASRMCPVARSRRQIDHTATAAAGVAKTAIPATNMWVASKSGNRAPQTIAPMTRSADVPRYRSTSIERSARMTNQATRIDRKAPAPKAVTTTAFSQKAPKDDTFGEVPLSAMPWPVKKPQMMVAAMTTAVARNVRRHTGDTAGRRPVVAIDWPTRIIETLPMPMIQKSHDEMKAGTVTAAAVPMKTITDQGVMFGDRTRSGCTAQKAPPQLRDHTR